MATSPYDSIVPTPRLNPRRDPLNAMAPAEPAAPEGSPYDKFVKPKPPAGPRPDSPYRQFLPAEGEGALGEWGMLSPFEGDRAADEQLVTASADLREAEKAAAEVPGGIPLGMQEKIEAQGDDAWRIPREELPARQAQHGLRQATIDAMHARNRVLGIEAKPTMTEERAAADSFVQGFLDVPIAAVKATGIAAGALPGAVEQNQIVAAADDAKQWLLKTFPGDEARSLEFFNQLARGGGSMAGFMAGGLFGRSLGAAVGASERVTGFGVTAGLGAGAQGTAGYEEAQAMGADAAARYTAFFLNAGLGMSEAIPIDRMFWRLNKTSGGKLMHILENSTAQSFEEFLQEAGQQIGQDTIAKFVYDENREISQGDALYAGSMGAVLGGLMGGAQGLVTKPGTIRGNEEISVGNPMGRPTPESVPEGATPADLLYPEPEEATTVPETAETVEPPANEAAETAPATTVTPVAAPPAAAEPPPVPPTAEPGIVTPAPAPAPAPEAPAAPDRRQELIDAGVSPVVADKLAAAPPPATGAETQVGETEAEQPTEADQRRQELLDAGVSPAVADKLTTAPTAAPATEPDAPSGENQVTGGDGSRAAPVTVATADDLAAATSRPKPEPTEAQKEAGNYQKDHIRIADFDVTLESRKGEERRGVGKDGKEWSVKMPAAYGYIKRSVGADDEQVDVYVGERPEGQKYFIVDQVDADTGAFDEHKLMFGFPTIQAAKSVYERGFSDGRGKERMGAISPVTPDQVRAWLRDGDMKAPFGTITPRAPVKNETPTKSEGVSWADAKPGDTLTSGQKLIRKGIRVKAEAKTLADQTPGGLVILDGPNKWAVVQSQKVEPKPTAEPVEHPGLVIQSLETGKRTVIQPKGTVPPKAEKPKAAADQRSEKRTLVGKNAKGKDVFEDENGVRSVMEGNVQLTEPVELVPTRDGYVARPRAKRDADYEVVEQKPAAPPAAEPSSSEVDVLRAAEAGKTTGQTPGWRESFREGYFDIETKTGKMTLTPEGRARLAELSASPPQEETGKAGKIPDVPARPSGFGAKNKLVTNEEMAELRAKLKAKMKNQLSAGVDPEFLTIGMRMTAYYIEAGVRKLADIIKLLAEDAEVEVDKLRPHIRAWYEAARAMMEDAGEDTAGMDTPDEARAAIKALAQGATDVQPAGSGGDQGAERSAGGAVAAGEPGGPGAGGEVAPRPAEDGGAAGGPGDTGRVRAPLDASVPRGGSDVSALGDGADRLEGAGSGGASVAGAGERGGGEPARTDPQPAAIRPNYWIADPESLIGGGPKTRFARNRAAIEAFQSIKDEGREPTQADLDAMAAYIGWGSFGQELFNGTWERPKPKAGWEKEDQWLREHLGQKEWESAQTSIINAHYTDPPTVQAMWAMVERMGFKGGRVLEPSMGVGNFFGLMPRDMMAKSDLTGIEMDALSGGMAKILYPQANIQIKPYQDSKTQDDFYDLVIGNWPFADVAPADRRYDALNASLHDYFFVKALDQVRPGGLVVGITSHYTMDKSGKSVRLALAKKAELVGAFRLPSGAFEKYAGTGVVTDIIVLKKRETALTTPAGDWIETTEKEMDGGEIRVNDYFWSNPQHVIGRLAYGHGTTSGRPGLIVERLPDFAERLAALPSAVPEGTYEPKKRAVRDVRYVVNNSADREGSIVLQDGTLYQVQGERMALLEDVVKYKVGSKKDTAAREAQVADLVEMRRAYGRLIDAERDGLANTETLRRDLRILVDNFRSTYGPISKSEGLRIIVKARDPAAPVIQALETADGKPSRILTEATTRAKRRIDSPTIRDAYVMARNETTALDIDRIAAIAKVEPAAAEAALLESGAVYRTPGGGIEASDVYLSGNVRRKLREALEAQSRGEDMEASIAALRTVIPSDTPYFQIEAQLGATWVSAERYMDFIAHLLGQSSTDGMNVRFAAAAWRVRLSETLNYRARSATQWGHDAMRFDRILRGAMNNAPLKVFTKDADGKTVVDETATAEVSDRARRIRDEFTAWAWADPERRIALERAYNEVFRAIADPRFDGSFLDFAGMALRRGMDEFSLRIHQINAIWRGVVNKRGVYAHEVGTGKTYTIAGIAIESRRYGVAKKPMILAHNANSAQVAQGIRDMYPGAAVLYVDNLSPDTIQTTLRRIRNEEWDAIVLPHSLADRMSLKEETLNELAREQIAQLEDEAIAAAADDNAGLTVEMMDDPEAMKKVRSPTAKQLVKSRERIKEKIKKMAERSSREDAVAFEDLGVDMLIVDEAHEFKKPPIVTKMQMRGLNKAASARSITLQFLTGYVKKQNGGHGVHLFTGTPITNTLTEIFHVMRYTMDDVMALDGVADWDAWFNTFAAATNDVELGAAGEYEPVTRLAAFVNVAELRRMAGQYLDIVFADDMPEFQPRRTSTGKTLAEATTEAEKRELFAGRTTNPQGRPYKKIINDVAPLGPMQERILRRLQELARQFRAGTPKDRFDWLRAGDPRSPIIIEGNATKASLDVRLFDPEAEDHPQSKVNRMVRNALEIYGQSDDGTQMIFMENGYSDQAVSRRKVPGGGTVVTKKDRLNLAKDIVKKLVAGGVPENQIAIVAGGIAPDKKKAIADAMNRGEIRFAIGLTNTMGTGVNAQQRLRAMHHMDAPWTPGELEQRNGRGFRQGNEWNTVLEIRYITEGLDGRRWQVLGIKDFFIKRFLHADDTKRVIEGDAVSEEEGMDAMGIAETLSEAAGDPRLLMVAKLKGDIDKLERRERLHSFGIADSVQKIKDRQREIVTARESLAQYEAAAAVWEAVKDKPITAKLDGKSYDDRAKIAEALDTIAQGFPKGDQRDLGNYRGFLLRGDWSRPLQMEPEYFLTVAGVEYKVKASLASMDATLRNFAGRAGETATRIKEADEAITRLEAATRAPFGQATVLVMKRDQLVATERDLNENPSPPPMWLRVGSPVDTNVYVSGIPHVVTGHRWAPTDWQVITQDGAFSYNEVTDEHGMPLYEARPFEEPVKKSEKQKTGPAATALSAIPRGQPAPPFYSAVLRLVEESKTRSASPAQWMATIKAMPGVKQEELDWLGVGDWLASQGERVSRDELAAFIRANQLEVGEVQLAEMPRAQMNNIDAIDRWAEINVNPEADWNPDDLLSDEDLEETGYEPPNGPSGPEVISTIRRITDRLRRTGELENGDDGDIAKLERLGVPVNLLDALFMDTTPPTKWQDTNRLPGGEQYRELLITLPQQKTSIDYTEHDAQAIVVDDARKEVERARGMQASSVPGWRDALEAAVEKLTLAKIELVRIKDRLDKIVENDRAAVYRTSHWDTPNVVAHVRFDERTDADGKRTLFIGEVQSDWHQAGRKQGYKPKVVDEAKLVALQAESNRLGDQAIAMINAGTDYVGESPRRRWNPEFTAIRDRQAAIRAEMDAIKGIDGVPDAPFKTTWPELVMKRMIRYAAENGYDQVAWTTGAQQVGLNSSTLRQQVKRIDWTKKGENKLVETLTPTGAEGLWFKVDGRGVIFSATMDQAVGKPIEDMVGKEIARRIMDEPNGTIDGDNLVVGGKFHMELYDKRLPAIANKIGKKFGAQVGKAEIDTSVSPIIPEQDTPFDVYNDMGEIIASYYDENLAERVARGLGGRTEMQTGLPPGFTVDGNQDGWTVKRNGFFLANVGSREDAERWIADNPPPGGAKAVSSTTVHALPITDAMRDAVMQGQPLFSKVPRQPARMLLSPAEAKEVERAIRAEVKRIAGGDVTVWTFDRISLEAVQDRRAREAYAKFDQATGQRPAETIGGAMEVYSTGEAMVRVALQDPQFPLPYQTAWHEAYHVVEMRSMDDKAYAEVTAPENMEIATTMAAQALGRSTEYVRALPGYEIRAYAFEQYIATREAGLDPAPATSALLQWFKKLLDIIEAVRGALARRGLRTIDRVFEDVYQGRYAGQFRGAVRRPGIELFSAVPPSATSTPAFKKWFGDSKVVNDDGSPKVVYHGTSADFDIFERTDDIGFHFGSVAQANSRLDFTVGRGGDDAAIMPVYLRIENPLELPDMNDWSASEMKMSFEEWGLITAEQADETEIVDREQVREWLAAKGYDGIVYRNRGEAQSEPEDSYIVFDPEQVKSVANRGTFDPANPSILLSAVPHGQPDPTDPLEPGASEVRREEMQRRLDLGQPIDRVIRIPFQLFGGLNERGEWKPGLQLWTKQQGPLTGAALGAGIGGAIAGPPGALGGAAVGGALGAIMRARPNPDGIFGFLAPTLENARRGLLDRYGLPAEYIDRDRERALGKRRRLNQVPEMMALFANRGVGAAEAKVLQAIINDEVEPGEWESLSTPIKAAIDAMGQEMVELGLISAEAYERNKGSYLHRTYMKHETGQGTLKGQIDKLRASRRKKIIGNQFKGRGLFMTAKLADLFPGVAEPTRPEKGARFRVLDRLEEDDGSIARSQGKVLERRYVRADQAVPADMADWQDRGLFEVRGWERGKVVLWRDWTKAERTNMGEILDARYNIAKTWMLAAHDIETGKFYRDIAANPEWATNDEPREGTWKEAGNYGAFNGRFWNDPAIEWVRVPTTIIEKSRTPRWGALSGMYVRSEIWRDINEVEIASKASTWRTIMSYWKVSKTILNPVVHTNNVMSNLIFMDLADVRGSDLVRAVGSMIRKDKAYQDAEANGAFGADMIDNEIRNRTLKPLLAELEREMAAETDQSHIALNVRLLGKMGGMLFRGGKWAYNKAALAYQLEDEIFRMALFLRRRRQGMDVVAAANEAREQFIDYDIRAPWVNAARNSVLPFIAYTYRAVPNIARALATRPWKIAKYFALAEAANLLAYAAFPGDEDEERRAMDEDLQGLTWLGAPRMIRMPFGDAAGNPVFMDIRRWIPAGDIFDINQGHSAIPMPGPIQFSGPILMAFELLLNRNAFTGDPIVNELTDTPLDRAKNIAGYLYQGWMPAGFYVPGSYYFDKISSAITGARTFAGNPYSIGQAALSSIGIKVRSLDIKEAFAFKALEFRAMERELRTQAAAFARRRARGLMSQSAYEAAIAGIIDKFETLAQKQRETFGIGGE